MIAANVAASKVAATALLTAIEMLEDHPLRPRDDSLHLAAEIHNVGHKFVCHLQGGASGVVMAKRLS